MNHLELWMHHPAAIAIGKTVLYSLWQGATVAALLAVALSVLRSSRLRYAAACTALLLVGGGAFLTFAYFKAQSESGSTPTRFTASGGSHRIPTADDTATPSIDIESRGVIAWLAPLWLLGVLVFNLRHLAGWLGARRMRGRGVCAAPDDWQNRLNAIRERMKVSRPVALLESGVAQIPVVIGHLRPVILLPVGLLAGLPAGQIELVLMHELAHVRRLDYLVNVFQTLVEDLMFYNPTVWWISKAIRTEREHCCDDLVIDATADRHAYATALAALEQNRSRTAEAAEPAMAATGGSLMNRIRRVLGSQPEPSPLAIVPLLFAALLVIVTTAVLSAPAPVQNPVAAPIAPLPVGPAAPIAPSTPIRTTAPQISNPVRSSAPSLSAWFSEDVAYIITDEERAAFLGLRTDEERLQFIDQFWLRRDPTPGTVENEFRNEHYARIAYTNRFLTASTPGWKTDRGRILIIYGKPDEIESHPSGGTYNRPAAQGGGTTTTFPFEIWGYRHIEGIGSEVLLEFVDPSMSGEYRMMLDPSEKDALLRVPGRQDAELRVSIVGAVKLPGIYTVRGSKDLRSVIAMAQGLEPDADVIAVVQKTAPDERKVFNIRVSDLNGGLRESNIPLAGEVIINVLRAGEVR